MDALDAIMGRRSIRSYTGELISEEDIETIVRAAVAAPSAGNQQPWHFIVTTDRDRLATLAETTPYGKMLLDCAFALVVCADTRELKHPTMWQQDCSAAAENALLAAHALGLGGVWLGFWPKMERVDPLKAAVGLPEGIEPLCILAFGHPSERKPPSERYRPDLVHRDRW